MKAIVQLRYGSPDGLELREIEPPKVGDDQVLVRVSAAAVNASDWHLMRRLPHLIVKVLGAPSSRVRGSDLAGKVEAVGKNVTRFQAGDEVFGVGIGSFAEYAAASEDRLAKKPGNVTFEQAAALAAAGCTALQGLRDKGRVAAGQGVLIYGAGGGVGTFAVQIAKALGAHVTAVTRTENLELVRSIGADEVVDYSREDFTRSGQRYDVVLDLGANRALADYDRILAPDGRLVLAGAPRGLWAPLLRLLKTQRKPRSGTQRVSFLARVRHEDLVALKELVEEGKIVPVIEREYSLAEVPDAIRHLGTGQARGKVVIRIEAPP
jgi:NADPH:quinone reductase-like Zn-dependent oxidoreductase